MGRASKYPDELRERAVRMLAELRPQYPSQWAAITAVAGMLGIGTPETLRTWIRRSEVDTGQLFADEGAHVFISGRRKDALEEAVELIGRNVTGVQGDSADLDDLD